MSKLYATMDSDTRKRSLTTRGHNSIQAHIRGWDFGVAVDVEMTADGGGGDDPIVTVYLTSGSNGPLQRKMIWCGTKEDSDL